MVFQSWQRRGRSLVAACAAAGLIAGCGSKDDAPPLATVSLTLNKTAAALGSPIDMTYRFQVAPAAAFEAAITASMHLLDSDGVNRWSDDHDPPTKTSEWKPARPWNTPERASFRCLTWEATILWVVPPDAPDTRAPLSGPEPEGRSYKVATLKVLPQSENIFIVDRSGFNGTEGRRKTRLASGSGRSGSMWPRSRTRRKTQRYSSNLTAARICSTNRKW